MMNDSRKLTVVHVITGLYVVLIFIVCVILAVILQNVLNGNTA